MNYKHIEIDPGRVGGKLVLKNTRLSVEVFMNEILEHGLEKFLEDRDYLDKDTVIQTFQEVISNVQRWAERDISQYRHTTHYFVTVVQTEKDTAEQDCGKHNTRCWGFYPTLEMAEEAVLNNVTDIHELWYQWAVIESYHYGVPAISSRGLGLDDEKWYHWSDLYKKYHETPRPKWAEGVVGWSIG